ncbi:MAG: hypothetical protein NAG76_08715 [Candidatus Pristimantibacillus lignocellulolyticus]|uniref:Lipoprotein n=1 Tax=Candidatus Pristimantibacillus lignocellulolyticus TaxID=2994561 RepID=A0A9J6ZJH9_9BACL|nr:MAG: hypothetical protein NAG76_08715 [Candidatus Pristimantibacillus lignocellulolyticus]
MKLKKSIVLLFLLSIILVGCASKDNRIVYKGESENWLGSYTISQSPNNEYFNVEWQFIYIGKSKPKDSLMTYEITSKHVNIKDDVNLLGDRIRNSSSTYSYDENELIHVLINIDGKDESLILQHK